MPLLDAVQSFVFQTDLPLRDCAVAAIFGRDGVYRLTPLDTEDKRVQFAIQLGLYFFGVIGFVDGVPTPALDYPIDAASLQQITTDFVARFVRSIVRADGCHVMTEERRRAYQPGGELEQLERLYQLPDARTAL